MTANIAKRLPRYVYCFTVLYKQQGLLVINDIGGEIYRARKEAALPISRKKSRDPSGGTEKNRNENSPCLDRESNPVLTDALPLV
jgi:hypothetical protein